MNISKYLSNAELSETRLPGFSGGAASNTAAASEPPVSASPKDEVSLSEVSQVLQRGSAQRAETLAALSGPVRSGSYQISSSDIGRSMVSELLARRHWRS